MSKITVALTFMCLVVICCATTGTTDSKNIAIKPGYLYSFDYQGEAISGLYSTSDKFSGIVFRGKLNVGLSSSNPNRAYLKFLDVKVLSYNGTWPDMSKAGYKVAKVQEAFLRRLQSPIAFDYVDGKVGTIYASNDETDEIVNIKRGILNLLHIPHLSRKLRHGQVTRDMEEGIEGTCESVYEVKSVGSNMWNISKARDTENCTCSALKLRSNLVMRNLTCPSHRPNFLKSKIIIKYQFDDRADENYGIHRAHTKASHIFSPYREDNGSIMTIVKQMLRRIGVKKESKIPLPSGLIAKGSIRFRFLSTAITDHVTEPKVNPQQEAINMLEKLKLATRPEISLEEMPYYFAHLVNALRGCSKPQLRSIIQSHLPRMETRQWLLDALSTVGNEVAIQLMGELIATKRITEKDAPSVFLQLPFVQNMTDPMIDSLEAVCKLAAVRNSEPMLKSCWLAYGSAVHKLCNTSYSWSNCPEKYVQVLHASLDRAGNEKNKILCLKAIGNAGSPSSLPLLLKEANKTANTIDERVAAVYAMRRITKVKPKEVADVLLPIHLNKSVNAEIRIAAVVVICDAKPSLGIMELIAHGVKGETNVQVSSFVYSQLIAISRTREPCWRDQSSNAYLVLKTLKPVGSMLQSRSYRLSMQYDYLKTGMAIDVKVIHDQQTNQPRSCSIKLWGNALGYSMNYVEIGGSWHGFKVVFDKKGALPSLLQDLKSGNGKFFDKLFKFVDNLSNVNSTLYLKLFGNEVYFATYNSTSIIEIIAKWQREYKMQKVMTMGSLWTEGGYSIPTQIGLPMHTNLTGVTAWHANATQLLGGFTGRMLKWNCSIIDRFGDMMYGSVSLGGSAISSGTKLKLKSATTKDVKFNASADILTGHFNITFQPHRTEKSIQNASIHLYNYLRVKDEQPQYSVINESKIMKPTKVQPTCYEMKTTGNEICFEASFYQNTIYSPLAPFSGPAYSRVWVKPGKNPQPVTVSYRRLPSPDKQIHKSVISFKSLRPYERNIRIEYNGHVQKATYRWTEVARQDPSKEVTYFCIVVQFPVNTSVPLTIFAGLRCYSPSVFATLTEKDNTTVFQLRANDLTTSLSVNKVYQWVTPYVPSEIAEISSTYTDVQYPGVDIATSAFTTKQFLSAARYFFQMEATEYKESDSSLVPCTVDFANITTFNNFSYHYYLPVNCPRILVTDCTGNKTFEIVEDADVIFQKDIVITIKGHKFRLNRYYEVVKDGKEIKVAPGTPFVDPSGLLTVSKVNFPEEELVAVVKDLFTIYYKSTLVKIVPKANLRKKVCGMCGAITPPTGLSSKYHVAKEWTKLSSTCHGDCPLQLSPKIARIGSTFCFTSRPIFRCRPGCTGTKTVAVAHKLYCPNEVISDKLLGQYLSSKSFDYELLRSSTTRVIPTVIGEDSKCHCSKFCDIMQ